MKEQWPNLEKIVKKFLALRSRKSDDRLSLILFDNKATGEIENESLKVIDL